MKPVPFADSDFFKAGGSGNAGCVEVAIADHTPDLVGLRDSKNPRSAVFLLSPAEWATFARTAPAGRGPDG